MLLRKGSHNVRAVKELQTSLKSKGFYKGKIDGDFGPMTEKAVKDFQKTKRIKQDGVVGNTTYKYLVDMDTDMSNTDIPPEHDTDGKIDMRGSYTTQCGLVINRAYLDTDEYVRDYGKIKPKNLFIHHTAGWDNPYNVVSSWNRDRRGRVGTQYIIGGQSVKNNEKYDGVVVETLPDNYIAWHLGKVGNFNASKYSVGIELNNFGYLKEKDGKYYTYVNTEVHPDQVCDLGYEFRGHRYWHKYSDEQIESLRKLIIHIEKIYPKINIKNGLIHELNNKTPLEAFEFNRDAYKGKIYGLWTHANVRKDKFDCYPAPNLVAMLKTLV